MTFSLYCLTAEWLYRIYLFILFRNNHYYISTLLNQIYSLCTTQPSKEKCFLNQRKHMLRLIACMEEGMHEISTIQQCRLAKPIPGAHLIIDKQIERGEPPPHLRALCV